MDPANNVDCPVEFIGKPSLPASQITQLFRCAHREGTHAFSFKTSMFESPTESASRPATHGQVGRPTGFAPASFPPRLPLRIDLCEKRPTKKKACSNYLPYISKFCLSAAEGYLRRGCKTCRNCSRHSLYPQYFVSCPWLSFQFCWRYMFPANLPFS